MANSIPKEIVDKAEHMVHLEDRLRLNEALWSGELVPTQVIIEQYDELITEVEEMVALYPQIWRDPQTLKDYLALLKENRGKYAAIRETED